jgi:hypothetical protein
MNNSTFKDKTISDQCRELKETYPDVLEKWRRFGDPLQKMMVEIIDKNAGKGASA